ncbi:conserved hypothetical protein, membrane [Beggiatoa sp. PS]|nr:conserved hypothetical protein, membrane [Beggiatoa sp. PS]
MKKFFKHSLPPVSIIKAHPKLQFFGTLLHNPNLWHFNRRTLAGGAAVGLFVAFLPIPMQMLLAAAGAIIFSVNLPLSVSLVWITNPVTIPPLFYIAYKLGSMLLRIQTVSTEFSLSHEWFFDTLEHSWQPLLVGSLVLGLLIALMGYFLIHFWWRIQVTRLWRNRREKRIRKLLTIPGQKIGQFEKVPL